MFDTLKNSIAAVALAALMAVGVGSSASAAVVTMVPNDSNVLTLNTLYLAETIAPGAGITFTHDYFFSLPDNAGANGFEPVSYSYDVTFPVPSGASAGVGIADLTFTVRDNTNGDTILSQVTLTDDVLGTITGLAGKALPGFASGFNFIGNWPAPIDLTVTVTGTVLSNGGSYDLAIAAVPLPAPLLLLVSALFGLGFLGRRRLSA